MRKAAIVGLILILPLSLAFTPYYSYTQQKSISNDRRWNFFLHQGRGQRRRIDTLAVSDSEQDDTSAFWKMQKDLAATMTESLDQSIKLYDFV